MAPARKKSKLATDDATAAPPTDTDTDGQSGSNTNTTQDVMPEREPTSTSTSTLSQPNAPVRPPPQLSNRNSWYSAASWKSKASPVAQVARESISVDKGVSSISLDADTAKRRPSQTLSKSARGSSRKSVPLVAEPTRLHVTSDVSQPPRQQRKSSLQEKSKSQEKLVKPDDAKEPEPEIETERATAPPEPDADLGMADGDDKAEAASLRPASAAWFGWWSRPDDYRSDAGKVKGVLYPNIDDAVSIAAQPETDQPPADVAQKDANVIPDPIGDAETSSQMKPEMAMNNGTGRSWFRLWSSTQNEQAAEEERQRRESENNDAQPDAAPAEPEAAVEAIIPAEPPKPSDPTREQDRPKSSGWAFWSKDKQTAPEATVEDADKQVGELAVADTPSQSHPEAAQFNREHDDSKVGKSDVKRSNSLLKMKRGRSEKPKDVSGDTTAAPTPAPSQLQTPAISQLQTPIETPEGSPAPVKRGKKPQTQPNLALPSFRDTYPSAPSPGVVQRLTQYIGESLHIPGYEPAHPPQHPYINSTPPKVKKAIAIGVHGYFPAALLQRVIGQPTGTSIRFANYAAASIKQWCHEHQPEIKDVQVEKVALEGEGFIADRVTTLWKLMLNWLSHLRQADFILIACHSQGVPVAMMLLAKLIQLGCLNTHVRLGVCAMAGVNLGPFAEYKSRFFGGTALELFDFSDSNSRVSIAYAESLELCLRHGVRITFVGSIDDQLVSLESSLNIPLSHPYVSRTVFIDGRLHTSNFLTHLVVFAVKLRNLGVSDHGLLRELSGPLAGSLVGGEGHSRVYDDPAVYRNAVEFALETTDLSPAAFTASAASEEDQRKSMEAATQRRASLAGYPSNMHAANRMRRGSLSGLSLTLPGIAPIFASYEAPGAVGAAEKNPFVLPWAVRGMLAEDMVKSDPALQQEVKELVKEFEAWKPTSKVLKDVRWRLEGVRSMI